MKEKMPENELYLYDKTILSLTDFLILAMSVMNIYSLVGNRIKIKFKVKFGARVLQNQKSWLFTKRSKKHFANVNNNFADAFENQFYEKNLDKNFACLFIVNVSIYKFKFNNETFTIRDILFRFFTKIFTDWKWNKKCKNYIKLD